MFIPVGGGTTTRLGEWKVENMDADQDCIQFLKAEDATKDVAYTFVSKQFIIDNFEPETQEELDEYMDLYAGWWQYGKWDSEDRETYGADNKAIPVGKGFLTLNMSGNDVVFQYAGEAPTEQTFVSISGLNPMLCNYIPRDIILDEMTVENIDADQDCFQKLKTDDATKDESYTYVSRQFIIDNFEPETQEELDEYVALYGGWWQYGKWDSEDRDTYGRGTRPFNAGASFLGLMMSGNTMKVWFPSSIPAAE